MPTARDEVDLPATLRRSPAKARRTFAETLRSAEDEYGDGARARRTAYAALKHRFEKVGDHWEPKEGGRKGPSDAQSAQQGRAARQHPERTRGGVDARASKAHLYERARELDIDGRSKMDKAELVDALQHASERATRTGRAR